MQQLFSIRAQTLRGEFATGAVQHCAESFLSGLVIGYELAGALDKFYLDNPVTIVGNSLLSQRYQLAFDYLNIQSSQVDADASYLAGILSIAEPALNASRQ